MKKLDQKKKAILLLYSYIIILFTPKFKSNKQETKVTYNTTYQLESDCLFATYNDKNLYIAKQECIDNLETDNPNNIYIIDNRESDNPNMTICNSHQIKNRNEQIEILKILLEYEKEYPSNWNRSIESMINEWIIHNICYNLDLETHRTEQVDLDNNDEKKYSFILNLTLNSIEITPTKVYKLKK